MGYLFNKSNILDDLKSYFESSNINFLLGSGCSLHAIPSLGDVEVEITDKVRKYSVSKDDRLLEEISDELNNFIKSAMIPSNRLIKDEYASEDEIHQTKVRYEKFLNTVYSLILHRGSNILPKKVNVFTTNYDPFLEIAAESLKMPYNDGGVGVLKRQFSSKNFQRRIYRLSDSYSYEYEEPSFNIIKLHGSLNWKLESDPDSILISNDIECSLLSKEHIEENGYIKNQSNIPIILPTKQKFVRTLMEHTYYDLSRLYSNELEREQSVLLSSGFSFEDEHIRSITQRALGNPYLSLYIFPFSYRGEQKVLDYFHTFPNVKVVRVNEVSLEDEEDSHTSTETANYDLTLAKKDMEENSRVNIDFSLFINILYHLLSQVSERRAYL
ncbi:SIR2 family protein [Virgibacillus sp. MG-45]|uniref:SIR2 family protein n=1 Tax=Virgibacillus sp. MG-45 TaxID=3102791 RepID=UPI002ED96BED